MLHILLTIVITSCTNTLAVLVLLPPVLSMHKGHMPPQYEFYPNTQIGRGRPASELNYRSRHDKWTNASMPCGRFHDSWLSRSTNQSQDSNQRLQCTSAPQVGVVFTGFEGSIA
ncbi:hypothetical protein O6H91_Y372800 [Diphasiastrum complanatum]|nr:hypothetical protein O6H91_Y372800 [Diphasiastrum complanatum]